MDLQTVTTLLDLNRQFYQTFGPAFAATRRRIQPGVRRVIGMLPVGGRILDLGCGSGTLALELDRLWITGSYLGLDSSVELLAEARRALRAAVPGGVDVRFAQADLADPDWVDLLAAQPVDVALCFAALHHLPGRDLRLRVLRAVHSVLPERGMFVHSEWQFQNAPKLMQRRQPWSAAGLDRGRPGAGRHPAGLALQPARPARAKRPALRAPVRRRRIGRAGAGKRLRRGRDVLFGWGERGFRVVPGVAERVIPLPHKNAISMSLRGPS